MHLIDYVEDLNLNKCFPWLGQSTMFAAGSFNMFLKQIYKYIVALIPLQSIN